MNKRLILGVVLLLVMAPALSFGDTITGPTYPAPGGNTFSSSGSAITGTSGKTLTYGGFDSSAYGQLWWNLVTVPNVYDTTYGAPSTANMSFSGFSGGVATWNSTSNLTFVDSANNQTYSFMTELVLAVTGATWDSTVNAFAVTNPSGFTANVKELAFNGTSWVPVGDLYNSYNHNCPSGTCLSTGFSGGFYSTAPTPTPEPGSLSLLACGFFGAAGVLKRRFRS